MAPLVLAANGHSVAAAEHCPSGWVALTFDDGPTYGRSEAVLAVLDRTGTRATFFSIGHRVARNPDMALAMVRGGHVVANHTWDHLDLTALSSGDIASSVRRTDVAFRAIGIDPLRLVRPPYLRTNRATHDAIHAAGFAQILETVESKDWMDIPPQQIANRVVAAAVDGAIIGLHDGHTRYLETAEATRIIIDTLANNGFCFGVLDGGSGIVPPSTSDVIPISPPTVEIDEMIWVTYLMGS